MKVNDWRSPLRSGRSSTTAEAPRPRLGEIFTPALVLDRGKLRRNAERILARAVKLGVACRPHLKTAKSYEVARLLIDPSDPAITVSTLAEAEYFFAHGIEDILYAVGLAPVKFPRVAALLDRGCRLSVILDSCEIAQAVSTFFLDGPPLRVLIEIDVDGHRAGVSPDDPVLMRIAAALSRAGAVQLSGVMTHAGKSYDARSDVMLRDYAERERAGAIKAAQILRSAGFASPVVSVGSTPTFLHADSLDGVTEVRVGVAAFGDLYQAGIGCHEISDIALSVIASVISHDRAHNRLIVDAGFLALSHDRSTATLAVDQKYGLICDVETCTPFDDMIVVATNQEHGLVSTRSGAPVDFTRFPLGSAVRILPNHACATAAAHGCYHVVEGSPEVISVWNRVNGW